MQFDTDPEAKIQSIETRRIRQRSSLLDLENSLAFQGNMNYAETNSFATFPPQYEDAQLSVLLYTSRDVLLRPSFRF